MSNLLKSKTFKVGGLVVALAMMVAVGSASAATTTTTSTTTTVVASAYTYSGVMKAGSKGPGVSTLQAALNSVQTMQIVVDGSFGPATKSAVMAFQASHGLVADGVVGPMTGAKLTEATVAVITIPGGFPAGCTSNNGFSTTTGMSCAVSTTLPAGCTSTSGFSPTTGMSCGSGTSGGTLSGGETDVSNVSIDDADDDTITENASKAPVADIQFDVDDADAQLVRADVVFQIKSGETGEDKPWDAFDKVYLMDGSTVLASMDASDSDNWDDAADITGGDTGSDAQRIRFNGINKIYKEGSNNNELWVAVDVASSVDGSDTGNDWLVEVDDEGLRFTDGASIDTFVDTDTASESAGFAIETSGGNSDITITKDSSSPDAQNLEVKESSSTTATVAVFKIKADEDGGDIKIDDFPISLAVTNSVATVSNDHVNDVVDDVMIVVDGHTYSADESPVTNTPQTFHFSDIEDDDVVVNAGDTMTVTVKVKFKSQSSGPVNYDNGATVIATSAVDDSDFEDADTGDDVATQTLATPSGETMTLFSSGVAISNFDSSFDTTSDGGLISKQTFTIDFDVTAFGDTFYIPKPVARETSATALAALLDDSAGLAFTVENSAGVIQNAGTIASANSSLTSSADTDFAGFFTVNEGDTETFHVTVELNDTGSTAGFYHVQLTELMYDLDNSNGSNEAVSTFSPAQDYETQDVKVD
ncbi:MAG TPA: peptidoglycan-binding domain-containing protein [Candidatus Paceibacterota bacterium]|jgi:hypothetical protein|nr:peptidoglycan-binding domain-containing protein [Candidatus Paceibacterota bacterium]